jgi:hypothetical protein
MGLAPARNKIQIAFSALESLLSLKRSMQHELAFKTLESDRKPILPVHQGSTPSALIANTTKTAPLPDCSRFPRSNATYPILRGIELTRRAAPPGLSAGPHSVTARRFRPSGAGRRDQGPYLQLHALWGPPWRGVERLARYHLARRPRRGGAQASWPEHVGGRASRGRTISSTPPGYRSTSGS